MKTFLAFVLLCSSVFAETIMVGFEIDNVEHRMVYDTGQTPVLNAGNFQWWNTQVSHIGDNGVAKWDVGDEYPDTDKSGTTSGSVLMWRRANNKTLVEFRAAEGFAGSFSTTPSLMFLFDETLRRRPPLIGDMAEANIISRCVGNLILGLDRKCSDVERFWPENVTFQSLDPVYDLFPRGDVNRNFRVDFSDFLILSANYGGSVAAAAVPEPSSLALLAIGLLAFLRRVYV